MNGDMTSYRMGGTLTAGGTITGDAINLGQIKAAGLFSIQSVVSGSGTLKIEYLVSNDNVTYVKPTGASDIVTAQTAGSDLYQFPQAGEPIFARYMKIRLTETGGANSVNYSTVLNVQ